MSTKSIVALVGGLLSATAFASGNELAVFSCNTVSKSTKVEVTVYEGAEGKGNQAKVLITNKKNKNSSKRPLEAYTSDATVELAKEGPRIQKATVSFNSAEAKGSKETFSVNGFSYTSSYEGVFRGEDIYCQSILDKNEEKEIAPASETAEPEPTF